MEPWRSKLAEGDSQAAWDLFVAQYRALMLATIRRLVVDRDDVMDVFAMVCEQLTANDFSRLRRYSAEDVRSARFSTWLVAVVRNLTIDWLRQRDGRRRLVPPTNLTEPQREIFRTICIEGRSHAEAYELLRDARGERMSFPAFLREVTAVHQIAPCPGRSRPVVVASDPASLGAAATEHDPAQTADLAHRIRSALDVVSPEVRLAVELTIVDRMAAADVAKLLGWPNAKSVHNRVYRALAAVRTELERQGIGRGDL